MSPAIQQIRHNSSELSFAAVPQTTSALPNQFQRTARDIEMLTAKFSTIQANSVADLRNPGARGLLFAGWNYETVLYTILTFCSFIVTLILFIILGNRFKYDSGGVVSIIWIWWYDHDSSMNSVLDPMCSILNLDSSRAASNLFDPTFLTHVFLFRLSTDVFNFSLTNTKCWLFGWQLWWYTIPCPDGALDFPLSDGVGVGVFRSPFLSAPISYGEKQKKGKKRSKALQK